MNSSSARSPQEVYDETISIYENQLSQVLQALRTAQDDEKEKLTSLRNDIEQIIALTKESAPATSDLDSEYEQFMSEMRQEGAVEAPNEIDKDIKALEGTKCKAPHKHSWGDVVYHNALISSVLRPVNDNDYEVRIMFINPTHQEMLPCPYFLDTDCKFSEDKCRYSHGEIVLFSTLKDYIEPDYESVQIGSKILAKNVDKLWHRASIKRLFDQRCLVKFESNSKDAELDFCDILPLEGESIEEEIGEELNYDDVINMSLVITPSSQALGDWERYTKGIGSKLMSKMGYVIGTGLGKEAKGITEPVSAVVLPAGKSLDHCMKLRENAGGDKDLFSAERKMKRLQKQQEARNRKIYEQEKKKTDVFTFLNRTVGNEPSRNDDEDVKSKHRQEIKNETSRNLNVAALRAEEDIRKCQRDVFKIKDSLKRHSDRNSQMYRKLMGHLRLKEGELSSLREQVSNIRNEQSLRSDKKKLTVF